eukprot:Skav233895  [mRNA]  locus=scaffold435:230478:231609:- [translate_table: standard]
MRRLRDWPCDSESDQSICFDNLRQAVLSLFDLEDVGQSLKYAIEEGHEGHALTPETLHAALESANGLLRVTIVASELGTNAAEAKGAEDGFSASVDSVPPSHAQAENPAPVQAAGTEPNLSGQEVNSYYEGWTRFKEQVVTDFRSNYQDMRGAVVRDEADPRGRQIAGHVAGLTAGVCATARFIPLHGTKLAAKSIATAAKLPAPESQVSEPLQPTQPEPRSEVDRFKQQVFQDFETGRSEIQSAFGYFVASGAQNEASESQRQQERPRFGKDVVPAVASTIAGLTIASTLVPLRATRLALASLVRSDASDATDARDTLAPSAPSDVRDTPDEVHQSEGVSTS